MQSKFDVIILSLAANDKLFETTKRSVDSYFETAGELINKVIVMETNKNFDKSYNNSKVEVIIPQEDFHYNKFYNIALEQCTSEFVIGPNNDVVIQPGCLQALLKEFNKDPDLASLCPVDRNWHRHTTMYLPNDDKIYYGYEGNLHMFGCLFCCRRSVFKIIGYLDERFYFFYQDNDYIMSLERCGLKHGVYTGAKIKHSSGHSDYVAAEHLRYTPKNMQEQGELIMNKWYNTEPFKSGGYKPFKEYDK